MSLPYDVQTINATFAASATVSGVVNIGGKVIVGFVLPSTWAAAAITFLVSSDGVTFQPAWSMGGTQLQIAAASTGAGGAYVPNDPTQWRGINMLMLQSGLAGSLVAQTSGAIVGIVVRSEI
jgi:hypothetical protein